ncbi:MAG: hypothetical protein L0G22_01720 [Propionibacteriaceae bacterium]|nr:hypothetical protein [Propionibacteriaceae bacterium]
MAQLLLVTDGKNPYNVANDLALRSLTQIDGVILRTSGSVADGLSAEVRIGLQP